MRSLLLVGTLLAATGVALGAFGAHALKTRLDDAMLAVWQTAVLYHLVHAVGIVAIALAARALPGSAWAGWLLVAGVLLFSGSLYVLALTGVRAFGAVTPLGGVAFIAGWLVLAGAAWKMPPA